MEKDRLPPHEIVGVILAGGGSTRMGTDKAMLDWGGVTLLKHMHRLLLESGANRVVVSGDRPGYDCIQDARPGDGPGAALGGVLLALPAASLAMVVPVDMPMLRLSTLHRLAAQGRAAHFAGYPLPALLPARLASGEAPTGTSIRALHETANSVVLELRLDEEDGFLNANTPDEWRRIQAGAKT